MAFEIEDEVLTEYIPEDGETEVIIPDGVTDISEDAFSGCSNLTSIVIPDSVTDIGEGAFSGCSGLTSLVIPDSVMDIGEGAFFDCSGLTSIIVSSGNRTYHSSGNCLIETESKKLILGCNNSVIPADGSVTSIEDHAFWRCEGLTSIAIPDSVTSIGYNAFWHCEGLTSIAIPDSVKSIGGGAFYSCDGLTSIIVSSGNKTYHSSGNCLIETKSKKLILGCNNSVIPADGSVTSIGCNAFLRCSDLASIKIPDSVTDIGYNAFWCCEGLTSIVVSTGNKIYHSSGNCLIKTESKTLLLGCQNSVIPTDGSVTSIGDAAFSWCSGLISIEIPNSVTSIGANAFYDCSELTSIIIPASVKEISKNAFNKDNRTDEKLDIIIKTPAGSYAEQFAKENGIKVENI